MSDEEKHRTVVTSAETPPARHEGWLRGGLPADGDRRSVVRQLTAASWVIAAGSYGYGAGVFGGEWPEYGWVFFVLGIGLGAGFAGLVAIMGQEEDDGN